MKQNINVQQLKELSTEQMKALNTWWEENKQLGNKYVWWLNHDNDITDVEYIADEFNNDYVYAYEEDYAFDGENEYLTINKNETRIKDCLPLLNIGQLIDILYVTNKNHANLKLEQLIIGKPVYMLCDILWDELKDVLKVV